MGGWSVDQTKGFEKWNAHETTIVGVGSDGTAQIESGRYWGLDYGRFGGDV